MASWLLYLTHVSSEDPDVVWMCECFADEAAFERAVSLVHAEVTKRLHELCVAGTEAYRLGLVAGKGLPRRLGTTRVPTVRRRRPRFRRG
ncbi:hypothetical protein ACIRPU_43915 [Streptomyces sp. NPDC102259]|uniref:hypothetical protein n=1 Tax=Streptomyces sp. NPDC102259 TaxID=3366148 RepID=UPI0038090E31